MTIKPTPFRRSVFIDIETVSQDPENLEGALSGLDAQVVCICLLIDNGEAIVEHGLIDQDEAALLRSFWALVRPGDVFYGHNVWGFDLPVLRQRSWVLNVRPSRKVDLRKFYSADFMDSQMVFSNWGATRFPSLDRLAAALGCGGKTGNGCQVADLWLAGEHDRIVDYCRNDVRIAYKVFCRLMFQPVPERFIVVEQPPVSASNGVDLGAKVARCSSNCKTCPNSGACSSCPFN